MRELLPQGREVGGPKHHRFPNRPVVEVPAGYPWQVASPQSLFAFHRTTVLSCRCGSSSIGFCPAFRPRCVPSGVEPSHLRCSTHELPAETGESSSSFDTSGGTQHITQALATVSRYAPPGKTGPDFSRAVGVTHENVEAVDITVLVYSFAEAMIFPSES